MGTALTERFEEALAFATRAHRGQERKGSGTPYVAHVLQVAGIALEHGADEDQAIAALLHDVIEDTAFTRDDIAAQFGERVADIVEHCSDADGPEARPPWRARKESYLAHLRSADADTALVSCADKLHNARSIVTDLLASGPTVWERFKGRRDGSLWYYGALVSIFRDLDVPAALACELERTVERMEAEAGPRAAPSRPRELD